MTFRSKIDLNYYFMLGVLAAFAALFIYLTIFVYSLKLLLLAIITNALLFVLILPMYFSTKYRLGEDGLHIYMAWYFNKLIPYADIFAFQSTYNAEMTFSLSDDRIAIYTMDKATEKTEVLTISPKDKQGFLAELARITGLQETVDMPTEKAPKFMEPKTKEERTKAAVRFYYMIKDPDRYQKIKAETPESFTEKQQRIAAAKERSAEEVDADNMSDILSEE